MNLPRKVQINANKELWNLYLPIVRQAIGRDWDVGIDRGITIYANDREYAGLAIDYDFVKGELRFYLEDDLEQKFKTLSYKVNFQDLGERTFTKHLMIALKELERVIAQ